MVGVFARFVVGVWFCGMVWRFGGVVWGVAGVRPMFGGVIAVSETHVLGRGTLGFDHIVLVDVLGERKSGIMRGEVRSGLGVKSWMVGTVGVKP